MSQTISPGNNYFNSFRHSDTPINFNGILNFKRQDMTH
ncbi:hypothetical protein C4K23_4044 [Pseudomonas chlororaphis]|nr:hypothetical protein C4K25_4080 [Pseudomonas chlororaphis]AZD30785.1 hypothetical protein C4K23_4044 [Pseudomonas chlororaphis]